MLRRFPRTGSSNFLKLWQLMIGPILGFASISIHLRYNSSDVVFGCTGFVAFYDESERFLLFVGGHRHSFQLGLADEPTLCCIFIVSTQTSVPLGHISEWPAGRGRSSPSPARLPAVRAGRTDDAPPLDAVPGGDLLMAVEAVRQSSRPVTLTTWADLAS